MWFAALRGIVENCELDAAGIQKIESAFAILKEALKTGGYFLHFMSELKLPDYAPFREGLSRLGLQESE